MNPTCEYCGTDAHSEKLSLSELGDILAFVMERAPTHQKRLEILLPALAMRLIGKTS